MDDQYLTRKPFVAIVIPTYTRADKLNECLASIFHYCDPCLVVVVANGAPEDTRHVFNAFEAQWNGKAKLIWRDEPLGYPKSVNLGIRAAMEDGAEFVVLLNDDALFLSQPRNECIDVMFGPMVEDRTIGITGPLEEYDPNSDQRFLIFFCVMIRTAMFESVGLLDETFKYFGEDTDFCIKAQRAGWRVVRVPEEHPTELKPLDPATTTLEPWKHALVHTGQFRIFHDAESTIGHLPDSEIVLRESRAILKERYGKDNEVNTPTGGCERCGAPMLDGVCIGAENKLNCDGLYLWRASVVDGWFAVDEGRWLAQRVKSLPKGAKVLSVGAWHGRSSRFIADNLPEGGQLWDVDSFLGSSGEPEMHGTAHWDRGDHAFQWYFCNLVEHIEKGHVVPVRMWSENAAHTIGHLIEKGEMVKFDLVFVDGDHSEEGIKTDVEAWLPWLKEGGLMCGHDYYKKDEGPHWVFVREYVEQKFPAVQKAATSIWWVRPDAHRAELEYQIQATCDDPEYAKVVESSQREILAAKFADINKSAAVLDVGCGKLRVLQESGFTNVTGVDIADGVDMHELPFEDNSFDVIYCSHALEHAYDPLKALAEFRRVLHPNGKLLLVLPYPDVIDSEHRAKAHCGSIPLGLTNAASPDQLLQTIESAGFTNAYCEQGNLRGEPEIYLSFKPLRPRIYDAFLFNDELSVLDIRLATLYDHVDRFVLVEGTRTHSGHPKPLHFDLNKERYAKYLDKIIHVVVDDYPDVPDIEASELDNTANKAWTRERHQRDAIMHGLGECQPDDIILLGDADEIANPAAISSYDPSHGIVRLKQRLFYYYLNCENKAGWDWQKIAPYRLVKELTPCGIRYPPAGHVPLIENGGWHFSFCGDADNAIKKIQDYAHVEYATPEILDKNRIEQLISEGRDIFGRDLAYEFVEVDDNYPWYVRDHLTDLIRKGLWRVRSPKLELNEATGWYSVDGEELPVVWLPRDPLQGTTFSFDAKAPLPALTVTACVSTRDRYETTLPMCLSAILNQTHKPEKLLIYDDGEQKDLRDVQPFEGLLKLADDFGVKWEIFATPRKGQVTNHQHCLDTADTDLIWRCDDDEIPEPNCLENLLHEMKDGVGAVAGLVHHPGAVTRLPPNINGSLNDLSLGLNLQWCDWNSGPKEVEHLYSTFLYSVSAAREAGGYPKDLSAIGHREESWFTIRLRQAGYKLIVTPMAKTWHLRQSTGGIRSYSDQSLWEHDEKLFQAYLNALGHVTPDSKLIVADMGIGDHLLLKGIWNDIRRKNPDTRYTLALCFPEVFEGVPDVNIISIADARLIVGDKYEDYMLYAWTWKNNKQQPIVDSMREFWGG